MLWRKKRSHVKGRMMEKWMGAAATSLHGEVATVEGLRSLAFDGRLPEYVRKLTEGYDLRVYWFELFECARKILLVGMPVFFEVGSVEQLACELRQILHPRGYLNNM